MRIVCGTDFSIHAGNAARVAAALARRCDTPLRLWHAVDPSGLEFLPKESVDHYRKKLRSKLVVEGNRLRELGADVVEGLALGRAHEVLAHAAAPAKADLIVISSIGQFAPSRWLVGSVAEKTAQLAEVPTLVVRDHERLLDWANGEKPLKVFVGYDFSASADAALHWVASLQGIGVCRTVVAYVSWPPQENWRFGIGRRAQPVANDPEIQALLERDLKERCAPIFGLGMPERRVVASWGSVEERLMEMASAEKADVVVLGTNQRHGLSRFWLGSVSRRVLNHTSMNVVCVPAAAAPKAVQKSIPTYRRVLAPTDFSKPGNRAIAFAYGAAPRGGEVCLVHVIPPAGGLRRQTETAKILAAKRKQELANRLKSLIPEEASRRGIRSRVEILEHEHPAAAICQAAERSGADLICIGTHARAGLKKHLLGSVTDSLLRRSKRPVLVVRE